MNMTFTVEKHVYFHVIPNINPSDPITIIVMKAVTLQKDFVSGI